MKNFPSAHTVLALLIVCALYYAPLRAQTLDSTKADSVQKPRENWYWVHGGMSERTFLNLGVSIAFDKSIITVKELFIPNRIENPEITDIGILYGFIDRGDWSFASCSFGFSYTHRSLYNDSDPIVKSESTVGIIGEVQASLKAYIPGLGVRLHGNLNLIQPYINAELVFHLGWMP